MARVVLRLFLD